MQPWRGAGEGGSVNDDSVLDDVLPLRHPRQRRRLRRLHAPPSVSANGSLLAWLSSSPSPLAKVDVVAADLAERDSEQEAEVRMSAGHAGK